MDYHKELLRLRDKLIEIIKKDHSPKDVMDVIFELNNLIVLLEGKSITDNYDSPQCGRKHASR